MKKILQSIIIFFFLITILFPLTHNILAACSGTCIGPRLPSCPAGTELDPSQSCTISGVSGRCCATDTGGGGGTGTGGTSSWGAPGSGPSLGDVSKLLGIGAPANASKAGFNSIIGLVLSLLILAAIILSLLFLIWGGFDWITSGGDKQKLQSARHKIVFAIVGLVIVFLAFFVVNVVSNLFGIK